DVADARQQHRRQHGAHHEAGGIRRRDDAPFGARMAFYGERQRQARAEQSARELQDGERSGQRGDVAQPARQRAAASRRDSPSAVPAKSLSSAPRPQPKNSWYISRPGMKVSAPAMTRPPTNRLVMARLCISTCLLRMA